MWFECKLWHLRARQPEGLVRSNRREGAGCAKRARSQFLRSYRERDFSLMSTFIGPRSRLENSRRRPYRFNRALLDIAPVVSQGLTSDSKSLPDL